VNAPIEPSLTSERELLWRFAPHSQRDWLQNILQIEHEVCTSLRSNLEHSVAHTRLDWWQDELQRLSQHAPRHPLTQAIARHALQRGIAPPNLSALAEGCRIDLARLAFETRTDIESYLHGWSQSVFQAATGQSAPWGRVLRELELLQDFSTHAWQGRIYWPLGENSGAHSGVAADWSCRPLGHSEAAALTIRLDELAEQLRNHCREQPFRESSDALTLARLWSVLVLLRTARARESLPQPYTDTRFGPLTLTLRLWWSAVQLQRGRCPTIL
jgi:phytoene/squalene synthetase